jgi:dTDP-4-amino-4,6-dideoxygalactose transaminase
VPFIRPHFPPPAEIAADYERIRASNHFTNFGPFEREFCERIADYVGGGVHAVTFANATLGLVAAISGVLGRGDGTRGVVVPSFTFAAGPSALEWNGYAPVFIDIEPSGLQPSIASAQAALDRYGEAIAGVLLCNSFGIGNVEIDAWLAWAGERGLPLVIDSAAGFGSLYVDGSKVGTAGLAEVFSFHATKPFGIGEGGAVVTKDHELARRLTTFQNFGFGEASETETLGLNAKLPELAAAIGLRQFARFDSLLDDRRGVLAAYAAALEPLGFEFPQNIERSSGCFASVLLPSAADRDGAISALRADGIGARHYYAPAVHRHPHFAGARRAPSLEQTASAEGRILSLPVHDDMDPQVVARIVEVLGGALD